MTTTHIGYKKIKDGFIVKLRIDGNNNEMRNNIKSCNTPFAKYRCERAFVLDIYHSLDKTKHIEKGYGLRDTIFPYTVGKYVNVKDYDKNVEKICSTGIHYFLSEEPAFFWSIDKSNYTGIWKQWYSNGQLGYQRYYKDGRLNGEEKKWYPNGQLAMQLFFKAGKLDGDEKWWDENGQLVMQIFFKNGQKDGEEKRWHKNGKLKYVAFYIDGKLNGYQKWWYNDQLASQAFYKDGKKDGEEKKWYPNGQLSYQAFYKNGCLNGDENHWHENGLLNCQTFYKDGQKDGEEKRWHKNGQLLSKAFYKDGQKMANYHIKHFIKMVKKIVVSKINKESNILDTTVSINV